MSGIGFSGQDGAITPGQIVEKISQKLLGLIDQKSAVIEAYITNKSKEDGMSTADQKKAGDQGTQDLADNIALAIYEGLKENNAAIISNTKEDSAFWQWIISVQADLLLIKSTIAALDAALPAAITSAATSGAPIGAALQVATKALISLQAKTAPTELKAYMKS